MAQRKTGVLSRYRKLLDQAGFGAAYGPSIAVACCIAIVLAGVALWRFWPVQPQGDTFSVQSSEIEANVESETSKDKIVVDVAGAVASPGVYTLEEGSRVVDAIAMAGGAREDAMTASLNLARILIDAEQVYVPSQEESSSSVQGAVSTNGQSRTTLVNINTADVETLCSLSGIGEATADKIIDDRTSNGPFTQVEDLTRVPGIGEKKLAQIRDKICV